MKKLIRTILLFFLFFHYTSAAEEISLLRDPRLPSEQTISPQQLPSLSYLWTSTQPDVMALPIVIRERELLFAPPPPPGTGTGGGGAVGEAFIADCTWLLVVCCLGYGLYCWKKKRSKQLIDKEEDKQQ
jgi:hypothetical protein